MKVWSNTNRIGENMKKLYFVILLIILQLQILQGGEIITHQEIAKRYLNADLVIIGEVILSKQKLFMK